MKGRQRLPPATWSTCCAARTPALLRQTSHRHALRVCAGTAVRTEERCEVLHHVAGTATLLCPHNANDLALRSRTYRWRGTNALERSFLTHLVAQLHRLRGGGLLLHARRGHSHATAEPTSPPCAPKLPLPPAILNRESSRGPALSTCRRTNFRFYNDLCLTGKTWF